jgi:hypothetical protein
MLNRQTAKLIKPLAPESGARKRARIARERFLRTVFYQGLNPLNAIEGTRPCYSPELKSNVNSRDELEQSVRGVISLIRLWWSSTALR